MYIVQDFKEQDNKTFQSENNNNLKQKARIDRMICRYNYLNKNPNDQTITKRIKMIK